MFTFLNAALLFGLFAVLVPVVIHILNRRRYDVVDWAAMQFLQVSERVRRKLFLEEVLLMALRMGLIALMALALAAPIVTSRWVARVVPKTNRDVVLIFDGSYSMGLRQGDGTADKAAREWARRFLDELASGDGVAVLQAKQQPAAHLATLSIDREKVLSAIETMPSPRGGVDWPAAINAAETLLAESTRPERDVIVLTDGQRHGWADRDALERWELLGKKLAADGRPKPNVWVVNVVPDRPAAVANWSLLPITSGRPVAAVGRPDKPGAKDGPAGSEVRFKTGLRVPANVEDRPSPPGRLRVEIDARPAGEERTFAQPTETGQIPISFVRRFTSVGSHLVTVTIDDKDDPLPGDNRQDFALLAVTSIPVLIVDGDRNPAARTRGSDFLKAALAPDADETPAFVVRVVPISAFDPAVLSRDLDPDRKNTAPRVVVLANVPRLIAEQEEAIDRFLKGGGGVLVTLGDRVDAAEYARELYRKGQGWLPAEPVEPIGDESDLTAAARPAPASFTHPAFELFRGTTRIDLDTAWFPRHWRLDLKAAGPSTAIAALSGAAGTHPWFVERAYGKGRVLAAAVPLDASWRTNLVNRYDFPRLAHELMYYLAATRAAELNLQPKQPIVFRPLDDEVPGPVKLLPPEGEERELPVRSWPLTIDETRETGVYRLTTRAGKAYYYVVQPDPDESVLTPAADSDRESVAKLVPSLRYMPGLDELVEEMNRARERQETWWLFMLAVVGLLLAEIWFTRRMALRNA